jgi:hypothetical protein
MAQSTASMLRFTSELVPGTKAPYDTWTFVLVPERIHRQLGHPRPAVRGTISGEPFRETIHRSDGVLRMLVRSALLDAIGKGHGDRVQVEIELDPESRDVDVSAELLQVLEDDLQLAELYASASPSMRRAWAVYVGEAKREETRVRRAEKARRGVRAKLYPNQ